MQEKKERIVSRSGGQMSLSRLHDETPDDTLLVIELLDGGSVTLSDLLPGTEVLVRQVS